MSEKVKTREVSVKEAAAFATIGNQAMAIMAATLASKFTQSEDANFRTALGMLCDCALTNAEAIEFGIVPTFDGMTKEEISQEMRRRAEESLEQMSLAVALSAIGRK